MSSSNLIKVVVNGESQEIDSLCTLSKLINEWLIDRTSPYVVSVNGDHILKENLNSYQLVADDKVEILTLRQGG